MEERKQVTIVVKDVLVPNNWNNLTNAEQLIFLSAWLQTNLHSVQIR